MGCPCSVSYTHLDVYKRQEYPCLIQARDGVLHLAFAYQNRRGIKWMSFREEDILGEKRERSPFYNPTVSQG